MNLVAIVGRPNVGKSTLFNKLIGERNAIVEAEPGVTRDRIYGESFWNGKTFTLIDTGGFIPGSENVMERAIREQAYIAIEDADTIIFVCDGKEGITSFDMEIATILRTSGKPIVLVINKCDNHTEDSQSFEFYSLGIGEPFPISGTNGRNTGDFLDKVVEDLESIGDDDDDERLKIALIGRPNVGKSSITNALLGKERSIVTDIPGTTRDAIDSVVKYYGQEIVLIDTAGLRKRSHVKENIEMYSILRTSRAIDRCDIAVVVIDASEGLQDQDKKIMNQVDEARKGLLIAFNKWDLVEKDMRTADEIVKEFYLQLKMFDYVPIEFISAITKQRINKVVESAQKILERRKNRISTSKLNKILIPEMDKTPPPSVRGRDLRINYITQVSTEPPVFAMFSNHPKLIPSAYKRFLERTIRKNFDFTGTPISLLFKRKNVQWEDRED